MAFDLKRKTWKSLTLLSISLIIACNQANNKGTESEKQSKTPSITQNCYIAVFKQDTAFMNLETSSTGKVKGHLLIKYHNNPANTGTLEGEFKGDTLFAQYQYYVGTYKNRIHLNPLAFLKTGNKLLLGLGEIETTMGRSYFRKGAPIDFEKGRFKFSENNCEYYTPDTVKLNP